MVLLHGSMTALEDMLLGPFEGLASEFRVLALDRPGHGLTLRPRLHGTLRQQAERLRQAMAELGVERPILVGHSRGGALALDVAINHPADVSGLVLLAPQVLPEIRLDHLLFGVRAPPGLGEVYNATMGRIVDAVALPAIWDRMFAPEGMPNHFRAKFPFAMATRPEVMLATGEEATQILPELALNAASARHCRVPSLVLAGALDLMINAWGHAGLLGASLPNGATRFLPGIGHMLHHSATDEVLSAVRAVAAESV